MDFDFDTALATQPSRLDEKPRQRDDTREQPSAQRSDVGSRVVAALMPPPHNGAKGPDHGGEAHVRRDPNGRRS
jgi:hypothetical protein